MLVDEVCRPRAGTDMATSTPAARTAETSGRRMTRSRIADHTRESVLLRLAMRRRRRFPPSIRSPSFESSAGSTVTEASMDTATTTIDPIASEAKSFEPVKNMPAMAIITVMPEMSTVAS